MDRPQLRFVPLLGVLFVVLIVAAFLVAVAVVPLLFLAGYVRAVLNAVDRLWGEVRPAQPTPTLT